jgi:hypothetical protein
MLLAVYLLRLEMITYPLNQNYFMAKYSKKAQQKVKRSMEEMKEGKLKSGRSGRKVTNPKQAIAIGLSEARKKGAKVPKKASSKKAAPKKAAKKKAAKKAASKKTAKKKTAPKKAGRKSTAKSK